MNPFVIFGLSRRAQGEKSGIVFDDCMYACVDAMECGDLDVNVCFFKDHIWDYPCIFFDECMMRRLCALKPNLKLFWRTTCSLLKVIHYSLRAEKLLLQMEYLWQDLQLVHAFVQHWASHGQQLPVIQAELIQRLEWRDSTRRAWLVAVVS
jgi:hypothetical protein